MSALNITKNKKLIINIFVIILIGIIIQSAFYIQLQNPYLSYFTFLLLIAFIITSKIEYGYLLFLFLLPNQRLLTFPNNDSSLLFIPLLFIFFKIIFLKRKIVLSKEIVFTLGIILLYSILEIFIHNNISNLLNFFKVIIYLLVPLSIFKKHLYNINWFSLTILMLSLGVIITSILSVLINPNIIFTESDRFSAGDYNNPNIFSSLISFAISCLFIITFYKKSFSLFYILLIVFLGIVGIATQSRSFIFAVSFAISLLIIYSLFSKKHIKISLSIIIFIVLYILLVVNLIPELNLSNFFDSALKRIIEPKQGDISNSRFFLWQEYIEILQCNNDYFLFGVGSYNSHLKLGMNYVAHNSIIELIVSWGLIGSIAYFVLFIKIWKFLKYDRSINQTNSKKVIFFMGSIPLFIQILTSLTGHSILNMAFLSMLFISFQSMALSRKYPAIKEQVL